MAGSIALIKSSDGTGNASLATVQSVRSPGATTLVVDTVDNIPSTFIGTMGTPHTFTDPITSETITVISEATAVDFIGHVSTTHLEIDTIAPGYTDLGSAIGDVVIIKPSTEWANNVADTLAVSHNDDGTLKNSIITNANVSTSAAIAGSKIAYNSIFNPYKFSVYRNASLSLVANSSTLLPFDTRLFDTGSNYSTSTFTFVAPIAGFYFFNAALLLSGTSVARAFLSLVKNGSTVKRGTDTTASQAFACTVSGFLQLAVGDSVTVTYFVGGSGATISLGSPTTYFEGYLVSAS